MSERIRAFYRIRSGEDAREVAEDICIEQTAEAHRSLVDEPRFREGVLGRVEEIQELGKGRWEAEISYPVEITARQIPQLLQVLYGNISLKKGIRLERLLLPPAFTESFPGPRHGIGGLRTLTGVWDRPLLAAALKPMGLSAEELAERAGALARGGIDIVKDDHGLSDQAFCPFEERVRAVTESLKQAREKTGRRTLYFPSITERFDVLERRVDWAAAEGADGVLMSPLVTGLDAVRHLAERSGPAVAIMAHPALAGAYFCDEDHGISMRLILGKLMRLAGADLVIFPSHGGRFPIGREDSLGVAEALRSRLYKLRASWPMPAGGIDVEQVPVLRRDYGDDCVLLIGSSLYTASPDLEASAARFRSLVE
jgi:ribulose-bisphosphate carboxylase large chain